MMPFKWLQYGCSNPVRDSSRVKSLLLDPLERSERKLVHCHAGDVVIQKSDYIIYICVLMLFEVFSKILLM